MCIYSITKKTRVILKNGYFYQVIFLKIPSLKQNARHSKYEIFRFAIIILMFLNGFLCVSIVFLKIFLKDAVKDP